LRPNPCRPPSPAWHCGRHAAGRQQGQSRSDIAVIGGLISSTLLSLVLVPVVYEVIDDFEIWLKPKLARLVANQEPEQTTPGISTTPPQP